MKYNGCLIASVLLVLFMSFAAHADVTVITPDGRRVILKDDHTWEYVEPKDESGAERAVLTVVKKIEKKNACGFGVRMENNLRHEIVSLIPQFSAYTHGQVLYETVSRDFAFLKPTNIQYHEIYFRGINCHDILYITVHGADRCSVGDLTKFSAYSGECLDLILIKETDVVRILKEEPQGPDSGIFGVE